MKIRLLSDLHLEMNDFRYEPQGEDVLVLGGDIDTRNRHGGFLSQVPETIKIFMVAGNHEYYYGNFQNVNFELQQLEERFHNFTFLNDTSYNLGDIQIFGGTMYTDFKLYNDPASEFLAQQYIADFSVSGITAHDFTPRRWNTNDHKEAHAKFVDKLAIWLAKTDDSKKRIVISHFVPTPKLIAAKWANSNLNPYFTCDMSRYMGWDGLWLCGHTHDCGNATVGDTQLWCNPYGYRNGQENPAFDNRLLLEI